MDAIVPAHNEESTIEGVVAPLIRARRFGRVVVVDDGSTDDTAERAAQAGATVLYLSPNRGKGQAMHAAVQQSPCEAVAFFDADLVGLRPEHVHKMLAGFGAGFDMVCGVRDYGLFGNPVQLGGPLITGERIVSRDVLERVHPSCWSGYSIETALNHACLDAGGRIGVVLLDGLQMRKKHDKQGFWKGALGYISMAAEIARCQQNLTEHGACAVDPSA